jgi:hypothetical protein
MSTEHCIEFSTWQFKQVSLTLDFVINKHQLIIFSLLYF